MVKIKMTPDSLGRFKRAYPTAQILQRNGDEYCITGIEENILSGFGQVIPDQSLTMRQQPTQEPHAMQEPSATAQNARPASVSQDARPQAAANEIISGENEFALVAKKFFAHIAQEKTSIAEKTMQEKIDEIFAKVEERNMFWTNRWNDFTRQLAGIEKQFTDLITGLESLRQKIDLMGTAWEDERSKRNGEAEANLADHKKAAEAVAKTIQYLREIPIPK